MYKAQEFFQKIEDFEEENEKNGDLDIDSFYVKLSEEAAEESNKKMSFKTTISDTDYYHYVFDDRSVFIMGSNGYLSCEVPSNFPQH